MFKRIRRYLVFLFAFTFVTANSIDYNVLLDESSLEAASAEQNSVVNELEENTASSSVDSSTPIDPVDTVHNLDSSNVLVEDSCKEEMVSNSVLEVSDDTELEMDMLCDNLDILEAEIENDTSLETVSYYIHKYQKLPPVYITKKEAYDLGGTLDEVLNHNSIGGDYFGNYQGVLPKKEGRSYRECDIDTLGSDNRGKKRLVYSNDGLMFYTEDHYATFTLLYSNWNGTNLQNL